MLHVYFKEMICLSLSTLWDSGLREVHHIVFQILEVVIDRQNAAYLGLADSFKPFNGWLDRRKRKHNVLKIMISGESGDVGSGTVASWKDGVPDIANGYSCEDV